LHGEIVPTKRSLPAPVKPLQFSLWKDLNMAKAKKTESSKKPEAKKEAAKKAPAKKPATTKKSAGPATAPLVDTTLAAQNAAKLLAAGLPHKAATSGAPSSGKSESALFKNLKEGLSKPHLTGLDSVLDKSAPGDKRSNLPFGGGKQVGHNQTFGADVNRTGVPRRTPG
jgi:hypothetical protein